MKKILIILFVVLFIIFLWGFIDKDTKDISAKDDSDEIIYSLTQNSYDLKKVSNLPLRDQDIIAAISRGLVKKDVDGKVICDLAESYEVKDDGLEYIFKLKKDVYWSDGSKINAKDIWQFFDELIKYEEENNIKALLNVYGASDYKNGNGSYNDNVAIHIDNDTIKFRLNKSMDNFIDELTKIQYRLRKSINLWSDIKSNYEKIKYCGYYFINDISEEGITITNTQNKTSKIIFKEDDSTESAMAKFNIGDRDIIFNPPNSELARINDENIINYKLNSGLYMGMNSENIDIETRQTIYRDIYEAINEYEEASSNTIQNANGCFYREDLLNLNLVQDRKVLINNIKDEAKPKNDVIINAKEDERSKELCEYLSKYFKEKKSYNIKYYLLNDKDFNDKLKNNYQVMLVNSDDKNFYSYLGQMYGNNNMNPEEIKKIDNVLIIKCQIMPICFFNDSLCISDKISNISLDYYGNIDFAALI